MPLTREDVRAFMENHRYAVVSSIGPDGAPQSALVGIAVSHALEVVFDSLETTRKIANIRANPRVSVVIGWENEQTLQVEGIADEPNGDDLKGLKEIYFSAWPDGPDREKWRGITYCRVRPTWFRFSSYLATPLIEEMRFPGPV